MGEKRNAYSVCERNLKERDCLENPNGRIISKFYFKKIGWEDMDWIHLAEDRDK